MSYDLEQARHYERDIEHHFGEAKKRSVRTQFLKKLKDTGRIKCVDRACGHIDAAAEAGSLWYENTFNDLTRSFDEMAELGIFKITAFTHLYCGLLAVKHRLFTVEDQLLYAAENNENIRLAALKSDIAVTWAPMIKTGSAENFMSFMNTN
jgi:hypothetical protein